MEQKKLKTKIGKLLSSSRREDEGFAEVVEYEPRDFLERQHGNIYFVVEVTSGSKGAVHVGETVINAIRDEFYDDLNRNVILSMESALRKANEELADITSSGETDWIGKLNVICAVVSEGKLHLSKVGATEAYILRGSKITHISEDGPLLDEDSTTHPLKTFSTITSGKLEKHDKIILSTSDLFNHITLSGIKKILEENTPSGAITKLRELLKDEEAIGAIGTLMIEMVTEDELASSQDEIDEIWIEEPRAGAAQDIAGGILASISGFFGSIGRSAKSKFFPGKPTVTDFAGTHELPSEANTDMSKETVREHQEEENAEKEEKKELKLKPNEKKEGFLSFAANYFKNFSLDRFAKDTQKSFGKIGKSVKAKTRHKNFKFLAGAILLLIISVAVIANNYYSTKNKNEAKSKYDQAIELYNEAESALIFEANEEAKGFLLQSKALTEDLLKSKFYLKESQELAQKIETAMRKAEGITDVSPNLVTDLQDENPSHLTFYDKSIYTIIKNGRVSIYNVETKESDTVETDSESEFISIASQPTLKKIILLNEDGEIYEIDTKTQEASIQSATGGSFKKGDFIATYNANLYIFSKSDNQIFRYTRLTGKYSSVSNYIADKSVSVANGVSATIPGAVIVLDSDGQVTKMTKGKKQEFALTNSSVTPTQTVKIQNTENDDGIYILDKTLGILIYKTSGAYQKLLSPADKQELKDFYVDSDSGIIYLLSGNKIVSFGK